MATRSAKIDQKADLIWAIADKLTGVYKPHEYGDVILPLTVIRRFDCILSDTKDAVLFKNDIDGFSLEERTVPEYWWSDNPEIDPWMWRAIIARRHDIVYGKFFDKKAGFISKKWLPVFANYRRDGYDFDALYDDGKAPNKHKKIMVNFMDDNADSEIYSNELKKQAGFGKDGEKGFDGAITNLMMQIYLCNCDFKKRVNKRGIEYGWDVAVYSSIDHIYGYDYVTSCYKDNPQDSWKQLVDYMRKMYPEARDKQIRKILK